MIVFDSKDFLLRPFDELLWPADSTPLPVCSWTDFRMIWKKHFPKLGIRNPCEDTCGECVKIRNSFKYLDRSAATRSSKHALHAQDQREYASFQIKESKDTKDHAWEERRFVSVLFFLIIYFLVVSQSLSCCFF